MPQSQRIQNFGGNLCFTPQKYYRPRSEAEILQILEQHKYGKIRTIGSKHAWSEGIQTTDSIIDLKHFQHIQVHQGEAGKPHNTYVTVGGGCQIKTLLARLNLQGLTLPTIGLIAEQTIAGAIATGTHGSGKSSLSHYLQAVRFASFDPTGNTAQIQTITSGPEILAIRCSLGCLGVITAVTLPCIPQYFIQEKATLCATIEAALAQEAQSPLQQFFLIPHLWSYVVQARSVAIAQQPSGMAWLYRSYWFFNLDLGLHLLIKLFAAVLRSRKLIHILFRSILPTFLFPQWVASDRSDRQLIMKHELFRHFEMEIFVPRSHLIAASHLITDILKLADNSQHQLTTSTIAQLQQIGCLDQAEAIRGCFTHHYPICFRRVLPDATLLSMTAGANEDWYAISLITYVCPRDDFQSVAEFLAHSMFQLFQARLHWGKWFPLTQTEVAQVYPQLEQFRQIRDRFDPNGVFRNQFIAEKIG